MTQRYFIGAGEESERRALVSKRVTCSPRAVSSADVLFVSKPVAPPWNDSSKNLVRDLAGALRSVHGVTLSRRGTGGRDRRR